MKPSVVQLETALLAEVHAHSINEAGGIAWAEGTEVWFFASEEVISHISENDLFTKWVRGAVEESLEEFGLEVKGYSDAPGLSVHSTNTDGVFDQDEGATTIPHTLEIVEDVPDFVRSELRIVE